MSDDGIDSVSSQLVRPNRVYRTPAVRDMLLPFVGLRLTGNPKMQSIAGRRTFDRLRLFAPVGRTRDYASR